MHDEIVFRTLLHAAEILVNAVGYRLLDLRSVHQLNSRRRQGALDHLKGVITARAVVRSFTGGNLSSAASCLGRFRRACRLRGQLAVTDL